MSVVWPRVSSEDHRTARYEPEVTNVALLSCSSMQKEKTLEGGPGILGKGKEL